MPHPPPETLAELLVHKGRLLLECQACKRRKGMGALAAIMLFGEDSTTAQISRRLKCSACGWRVGKASFDYTEPFPSEMGMKQVRRMLRNF